MLRHPILDALEAMKLQGMSKAFTEQLRMSDVSDLSFDERFGLIVDREQQARTQRSLTRRLQVAKLRISGACVEDVDFRASRNLDKGSFLAMASCDWLRHGRDLLMTGATGVGKTWLACALGQKACREGFSVRYYRLPRLLESLALSHADGTWNRQLKALGKVQLLILDDWGIAPFTDRGRRDLFELLDDRHRQRSTLIASQMPTSAWHKAIGDPTIADALMDRLVHGSYRFELGGESIRKLLADQEAAND